jgi:hypothetical protein
MAELRTYDTEQQSRNGQDADKAIHTSGRSKKKVERNLGEMMIPPNFAMHLETKLNLMEKITNILGK